MALPVPAADAQADADAEIEAEVEVAEGEDDAAPSRPARLVGDRRLDALRSHGLAREGRALAVAPKTT